MKKVAGKLAIIFIPIIAALALLYPTYDASRLEGKRNEALRKARQAGSRADSLAVIESFNKQYGEDLQDAKNSQLKLGLDLQGGMYVNLEVDVLKLIEESAQREAVDEIFETVIARTKADLNKTEEAAIDVFLRNFDRIAKPQGRSLVYYFDIGDTRDVSEEAVVEKLERNADEAINQAQEVIRQRIDKYGVSEPNIQKQGNRRIVLELPGVKNESEMRQLLETTARLEFKLVRNNREVILAFDKINKFLAGKKIDAAPDSALAAQADTTKADTTKAAAAKGKKADTAVAAKDKKTDTAAATAQNKAADTGAAKTAAQNDTANPYAGMSTEQAQRAYWKDHKFTSLFATYFIPGENQQVQNVAFMSSDYPEGQYIFSITRDSVDKLLDMLTWPEIKALMPFDVQVVVGAKPDERIKATNNIEVFDMYAVKRDAELTGDVITDAVATYDPNTNEPMVLMEMNTDGAEKWSRVTGGNIGKQVAVVLDERVYSAPVVRDKISGGSSQITGMSNADEARLLEIVLKAGALKAPVQIVEERVVGPSLGRDSINDGLTALLFAALLVILFMVLYYATGGVVADIAVLINILLIVAVLAALGGTLTLPGIAGIILTIGMAVDANILIFERIREELERGRSLRSAIDEGFSKALSAILDSNVTTFISGLILYYFGSGPVQGFALTLMIGILATLFTTILVSRALIEVMLANGSDRFNFGQPKVISAKS